MFTTWKAHPRVLQNLMSGTFFFSPPSPLFILCWSGNTPLEPAPVINRHWKTAKHGGADCYWIIIEKKKKSHFGFQWNTIPENCPFIIYHLFTAIFCLWRQKKTAKETRQSTPHLQKGQLQAAIFSIKNRRPKGLSEAESRQSWPLTIPMRRWRNLGKHNFATLSFLWVPLAFSKKWSEPIGPLFILHYVPHCGRSPPYGFKKTQGASHPTFCFFSGAIPQKHEISCACALRFSSGDVVVFFAAPPTLKTCFFFLLYHLIGLFRGCAAPLLKYSHPNEILARFPGALMRRCFAKLAFLFRFFFFWAIGASNAAPQTAPKARF